MGLAPLPQFTISLMICFDFRLLDEKKLADPLRISLEAVIKEVGS